MRDKYIKDIEISKLDNEITNIVNKNQSTELGGKPMVIAIKNENGLVYRELITFGLSSYLDIVQSIAKLGLVDLYANDLSPNKYDSLFVFN
ncbi:hypothetical protein RHO14_06920 [Orbus wheelerorum]|uniref:hypothetical protein n=1 Tax=Orbus wheelerorum TaxID=3074111 RepID=UPI00370D1178